MRTRFAALALAVGLLVAGDPPVVKAGEPDYVADVESACAQLGRECAGLLRLKKIDWAKVTKIFVKEARGVDTPQAHLALLRRLVARLQDGHAGVLPTDATRDVRLLDADVVLKGPGLFWCRVGKRLYVKNSWASAERVGITPGMEILTVDDKPAARWLAERMTALRDVIGFSSEQHAEQFAFHSGLAEPVGTRVDYGLRDVEGKRHKRTVVCERAGFVASGPAFPPAELQGDSDVAYGKTAAGHGYVQVRRCKSSLPYRMDDALKTIGAVPGMILDFRANGGGGFGHEDLMGRFIPAGASLGFAKHYESRGDIHYAGPVVVIVDGMTRSAGETASGMFKEDGRAYMIGPCPTAGMSSSKKTLDLPSGLFQLYVSVASNMGRFNDGRGIEGIGVIPHELVAYDPEDLAAGRDTLILRAEALFARWPRAKVPYDPARFGWKAP